MIAFLFIAVSVFAATGNENDLANLRFDELKTGTLDVTDEIVYFESDIPKQGATVDNLLALAEPADVENANGDLIVTRDLSVTRNASVTGTLGVTSTSTFTGAATFTGNIDANADIVGDGGGEISGMLADVQEATTDTLTVAESGIWTIKTSATTSTLPAWATGLEFKLKSSGAYAYSVDPASTADTIYVAPLVLDGGDKITSTAATGNTVHVIAGTTANKWYATCYPSACTDGGA